MSHLIEVENVSFAYKAGEPVLRGVSFVVDQGDFVAVTGPSGSGKSTLFYLLGALASSYTGDITFQGKSLRLQTEREKAIFRNDQIGFVFQQFHLMSRATVLENVLLPAYYPFDTSRPGENDRRRAIEILNQLGLGDLVNRMPHQLSGGQQQRVAIARALIRNPSVILADEPTGNLDSKSTETVMDVLKSLHADGKTIILITHSEDIARQSSRTIRFKDGQIELDSRISPLKPNSNRHLELTPRPIISQFPLLPYVRSFRPAWINIVRTKAKAALTMVGVVLGIAAVLTTVSLGTFAKQKILASYESLGVNTANMEGWPNWRRSSIQFTPAVFRAFTAERDWIPMMKIFDEIELLSPLVTSWSSTFNYGGLSMSENTVAMGVSEQYYWINNQILESGRTLSALDVERANPVCVIGNEVKRQLFARESPLEKTVTIVDSSGDKDIPCRVIGTLKKTPSQVDGKSPDNQVYLPYEYLQRAMTNPWEREIRDLRLKIRSGFDPDTVGKQLEGYFKSRYGNTGQFRSSSNAKVVAQMRLFLNVFSTLLTAVAMIALLVGGVGINNMMLVNLSERLKELGLRKALGATPVQIRAMVLTESVVLCGLGGLIGVVSGFIGYQGLIYSATRLLPNVTYEWIIEPFAVLIAFGAIFITGILSGLVPALRAERLEVIEALRQDQ